MKVMNIAWKITWRPWNVLEKCLKSLEGHEKWLEKLIPEKYLEFSQKNYRKMTFVKFHDRIFSAVKGFI